LAQSVQIEPLCYLLRDLRGTITQDLSRPLFLKVRDDLVAYYDEMDDVDIWGVDVGLAFPSSVSHIGEARRCLALERWEASAHHLMLAVERAIRVWARRLRLRTRGPLELEDLQQTIQAAEGRLKELRQRPRTRAREKAVRFLSEAAGHLGFIKNAWRNPSAHGRASFDERKVKNLMTHVEAFGRLLASARARPE
jgi:hypothetical protein